MKSTGTKKVDGRLKMSKTDSNKWKLGNVKFTIGPANLWIKNHLIKFRKQRTLVQCWIRDDGILLSVKALRAYSQI